MQTHDKIKSYVELICEQIRWKKAHVRVSEEMINHITDSRDALISQGLSEEIATETAIESTGDATTIGIQLDRTHRPKPQWVMLGATALLIILGLLVRIFIFNDEDRVGLLYERLFYTGVGIVGMLVAYFVDFTLLGKFPKTLFASLVAISIFAYNISQRINGKSFYAQYIMLLFPLAFAVVIFSARNKKYLGIFLCGLTFIIPGLIALNISSISMFVHFFIVGIVLFSCAVWKNWFNIKRLHGFILLFVPVVFLSILFILKTNNSYYRNRIVMAFKPSLDPSDSGYWGVMTRELLSGARFFGQGEISDEYIGLLSIPNAVFYTDSLLTALISLVGWISFMIIIGVILFFIVKGFMLCFKQKSSLGFFVSLSIIMTFCVQAVSYVVYNLGIQLAAPISLPLISFGNTATIVNLVLIGFMLSVFRTGDIVRDNNITAKKINDKFIIWNDGKLTINLY